MDAGKFPQNEAVDNKIAELQLKLEKINSNRKKSSLISLVGIVLIIIALASFVSSLYKFVEHYDTTALLKEFQSTSSNFASSEEVKQLIEAVKQDLIPSYEVALSLEIKKSAPQFQKDFESIKDNLSVYLNNTIKPKIEKNLITQMSGSEETSLTAHLTSEESKAKIRNVVMLTKEQLTAKMPGFIDNRIDPVLVQLDKLNDSFYKVYDDMVQAGEFNGVTPDMSGEIENRLIENILEMMIYQLDPQKANQKAN